MIQNINRKNKNKIRDLVIWKCLEKRKEESLWMLELLKALEILLLLKISILVEIPQKLNLHRKIKKYRIQNLH